MGLFTKLDRKITKVFHKLQHAKQDEGATIYFETLDDNNAPVDLVSFDEFEYDERTVENKVLPPDVMFELRISEELIDPSTLIHAETGAVKASSLRHQSVQGLMRYKIDSQSPFWPSGFNRVWRFWISPIAVISLSIETFNLIDDAGNNIVDDAGNQVVAI